MSQPSFDDLAGVIRRVFSQPDLRIARETQSVDVPGWDSLSHVMLVLELQTDFDASIQPDETLELPNVGALHDLLLEKCA